MTIADSGLVFDILGTRHPARPVGEHAFIVGEDYVRFLTDATGEVYALTHRLRVLPRVVQG